jgi:hypothetical protein
VPPAASPEPGRILGCNGDGVWVGTADGSLLVTAMSDAGARPEPAAWWARRSGLHVGDRFCPVPPAIALWALGLGPEPAGATRPEPAGAR